MADITALRQCKPRRPPRAVFIALISLENWSGRWDSNPRPQPWQGCALPLSYTRGPKRRRLLCQKTPRFATSRTGLMCAHKPAGLRAARAAGGVFPQGATLMTVLFTADTHFGHG